MIIKYQRTSTSNQEGNRFLSDTDTYDFIFFDRGVSGLVPFKERHEAKKIIKLIHERKVTDIVVHELRDIGRDISDTLSTLKYFEENQICVTIKSFSLKSHLNGKKNELWGLVTSVMSSLYAIEIENLKARTTMGLQAYKLSGGILGRPRGSTENEREFMAKSKNVEIVRFLNLGKSTRDISARLKVSTTTVLKVKNVLKSKNQCLE